MLMPFYGRKIIIIPLVIIASFLAWLSYLWAVESYRPNIRQTKALTAVADQVHAIMQQEGLDFIQTNDEWSSSLEGKVLDKFSADIEKANSKIEHAAFSYTCRPECYFTAYFYIDGQEDEFVDGTSRYFQYNPDGHLKRLIPGYSQNKLTEHLQYNQYTMIEEFVPSISQALKAAPNRNRHLYLFCEPLEQKHWHYCKGYQSS